MSSIPAPVAAELCRASIEEMIQAGQSFGAVEERIATSGLPDEQRSELWQFGWQIWSARVRELNSTAQRRRRFTRFSSRGTPARPR